MKLHTRILLGLVAGAAAGMLANVGLGAEHPAVTFANTWIAGPVGQVFLRLLFMVVMPLVFASISLGVAGIGDVKGVGRVGGKALLYFLASTTVASAIGIAFVRLVQPGAHLAAEVRAQLLASYASEASAKVEAAASGGPFGIQTFVAIVTRNPLKSAVDGDMLGVIFFGIMFGTALTLIHSERAKPMVAFLEALNDVVVKIVEIAMKLAPWGVAGLVFGVTSRFGFALLRPLGLYVATVLGGLAFHGLVSVPLVVRFGLGLSPLVFFSRIKASLVTAFSTSSSSATLPTNLSVAEDSLGVPPKIAGFVLPLGTTMCMNGTALFEGVTVLFLCQVFGVELSLGQTVVVVVMAVITAVGAAAVPGGSIPLLVGILAMVGVPGEAIAIVLGVDRLLDMTRTVVNVLADLAGTVLVAKSEGSWTSAALPVLGRERPLDDSPGWPREGDIHPRPGDPARP